MIDQLSGEGKVARLGRIKKKGDDRDGNFVQVILSPISNGFVRVFAVGEGSGHLATEPPEPHELLQVLRAM